MTLEMNDKQAVVQDDEIIEAIEPRKEKEETASDEVFVIKRTTFNYLIIAGVFLVLGLVIGLAIGGSGRGGDITSEMISTVVVQVLNSQGSVGTVATPGPAPFVNVSVDDDPAWGPKDAPVTIVEFSDFQCPFCERFHQETYSQLRADYEGKIHFVYRDFPISSLHPDAMNAALAADCANDQGAFWTYHDLLFDNQQNLSRPDLSKYATQLNLDVKAFDQCLDSSRYQQEIAKDMQDAGSYGVRGTPTFFINGRPVVGAQPYAVFASVINEELAKVNQSQSTVTAP